jgi:hypothetical protein
MYFENTRNCETVHHTFPFQSRACPP